MCGIIGIITKDKQVSYDLYNGLLNLQHRGQDNAGIFTSELDKMYIHKGQGLVAEVFTKENVENLKGNMGIGQVRYPTTIGKADSQPFYVDQGGIALAHNGNLFNESGLRDRLKENRIYCDSDCDAETILKIFSFYFNKKKGTIQKRCFAAAKKTMQKLDGSYSVIAIIRDVGFFAFRDPHAIRPFVFGKKTKNGEVLGFAFSSESVAIDTLVDSVQNVKAGEAIFVNNKLTMTRKSLLPKNRQHCMFEWVYFSRATSVTENIGVNQVRGNLGKCLSKIYLESPLYKRLQKEKHKIIVAPIPETSRPASIVFALHTKYQFKDILEKNRFAGRIFIKPSESLRRREVAGNFKVINGLVKDKIVFLIDDSIVRGTTSKGIVEKVREKGAREVHLFSTSPPIIHPCFYGVDMPTSEELIAYKKSLKQIEDYIGADSVTYVTIECLAKAIGLRQNQICTGCLNGKYPTPQEKVVQSL